MELAKVLLSVDEQDLLEYTRISEFSQKEKYTNSAVFLPFNTKNICFPVHYNTDSNGFTKKPETQYGILSTDEYKGFNPIELVETTVEYRDESVVFVRLFKVVILEKSADNMFYPNPYLVICPELELEGIGITRNDAFNDICNLFNIYFNETKKISDDLNEFLNMINAEIDNNTAWKQDFNQLCIEILKNDDVIMEKCKYHISIKE